MLEQMRQRLHSSRTLDDAVRTILLDVVALDGAEFGNVQMPLQDRLLIVAQHGLSGQFLETFREVRVFQAQALIVLFWGCDRPGEIPHLGRLG